MIVVRLKQVMNDYRQKNELKSYTYWDLVEATGLSYDTLQSLGSRNSRGTTFYTLDKICRALESSPSEILLYNPSKPHPKPPGRKEKKKATPTARSKKRKKQTKKKVKKTTKKKSTKGKPKKK